MRSSEDTTTFSGDNNKCIENDDDDDVGEKVRMRIAMLLMIKVPSWREPWTKFEDWDWFNGLFVYRIFVLISLFFVCCQQLQW